jgi:hypothetical protein
MMLYPVRQCLPASLVLAVLAFGPPQARAEVVRGFSSGYGAYLSLSYTPSPLIAPVIGAGPFTYTAGPLPSTGGVAPAPYDRTLSALSLLVPPLNITRLGAHASSNVDGLPGVRFAHADAGVATVGFGTLPFPPLIVPPFLSLTFASATSTADVSGDDFFGLTATASSTLTGGILSIPLLPLIPPIILSGSPVPNTVISPKAGLTIVLNEQRTVTTILPGYSDAFISVNAVHATLTGLSIPGVGTFSGDLILAHSEAGLVTQPEPGSVILAGAGVSTLLAWRWRRRKGDRSLTALPPPSPEAPLPAS